jgi:cytoskeletal protein RodZ
MNNISENIDLSHQTLGQALKARREAKQLSANEIAQKLLLSTKVIISIEEDDYSKIPAQVYAEGYLKAYSKILQISVDAVLENFRGLDVYAKSETEIKIKTQPNEDQKKLPRLLKKFNKGHIILGVLGALILGVLVFFTNKHFGGEKAKLFDTAPHSYINNNANNDNLIISDNQMPIITTTSEDKPISKKETLTKKKPEAKNTRNISLMLETNPAKTKPKNSYGEPNLIITKPKKSNTH